MGELVVVVLVSLKRVKVDLAIRLLELRRLRHTEGQVLVDYLEAPLPDRQYPSPCECGS
jgi:hypothetical protein